jgi:hypothetical protein
MSPDRLQFYPSQLNTVRHCRISYYNLDDSLQDRLNGPEEGNWQIANGRLVCLEPSTSMLPETCIDTNGVHNQVLLLCIFRTRNLRYFI